MAANFAARVWASKGVEHVAPAEWPHRFAFIERNSWGTCELFILRVAAKGKLWDLQPCGTCDSVNEATMLALNAHTVPIERITIGAHEDWGPFRDARVREVRRCG